MPSQQQGAESESRTATRRRSTILMAVAVCANAACGFPTEPEPEIEIEPELPAAHVRVCWASDAVVSSVDCRGDGHWGHERVPPRSEDAVPIPGVAVRICLFSAFDECHARTPGHFLVQTTDSDGYAVFPDLVAATYLFLPDVEEIGFGSCTLVSIDEYGGALKVEPRVLSTPIEYQNGHIGELWFVAKSCDEPIVTRGCPPNSPTWMGLSVCEEYPRVGYDRDAFGRGHSSLEDEIIAGLPQVDSAKVYTPYTCTLFDIRADGTAATDIDHIVALAEAYDSGLPESEVRA